MVKVKDNLIGKTFGQLTVLEQTEDYIKPNGKHESRWLCRCNCNNNTVVLGYQLKSGHTRSCGCLQKEVQKENGLKTKNLIFNEKKYNAYDLSGEFGIGYTSKNEEFWFDLEDYDKIKNYCWYIDKNGYVVSNETYMHVLILNTNNNTYVDHIQHNKSDNRKSELRIVTPSQSNMNRSIQSNNTSGTTGVSFHKDSGMWFGYIKYNNKQIRKYAQTKQDAIKFRKQLEEEYFKQYSYDNSMKGNNDE